MAEYIERKDLLARLDNIWDCGDITFPDGRDHICKPEDCKVCKWRDVLAAFKEMVKCAPAADVEPVVHAHWYQLDEDILCSHCGKGYMGGDTPHEAKEHLDSGEAYDRCPHCGAKMDGEATEGD